MHFFRAPLKVAAAVLYLVSTRKNKEATFESGARHDDLC